jgi:predicted acyl esterase
MYLDANSGRLLSEAPEETGQIEYEAQSGQALFNLTFEEDTRLVGNMKLRLWISTDAGRDIDLFIGIKKFDQNNAEVTFFGKLGYTETPVAMGWLRVSERLLDEGKSTPWQPVLAHEKRAPVKTGEIYPVDIEILPSGTLFRAGESLQLVVQGKDLFDNHPSLGHHHLVNEGNHTIYTGDEYGSYLLIPVIP